MLRNLTLVFLLAAAGCVAPVEVKQASAEVGVGLSELSQAQKDFQRIYLREIEATRQQIGRAIVARGIMLKVQSLAEQEAQGDLLAISEQVEQERALWTQTVQDVLAAPFELDENGDFVGEDANGEPRQIEAEDVVATALSARLQANQFTPRSWFWYALTSIVELRAMARDVNGGMRDLADYVDFLAKVHATVNGWVAADVTVSGEQVAELIDEHAALIGLSEEEEEEAE